MLHNTIIFLLAIISLHCSTLFGQNTFSININQANGLPSQTVYDLMQDSKGFVWIASNTGISKYDGFEFVSYSSSIQSSLAGTNLKEDNYGRMWYQNFDGYLYYIKDEKIHSLKQNRPGEFVPFGIIGDNLFVVQQNGVDVFDLRTLKIIRTIKVDCANILTSTVLGSSYYFSGENKVFKIGLDFKLTTTTNYFNDQNLKVNIMSNDGNQLFLAYKNNTGKHTLYFLDDQLKFQRSISYNSDGTILALQYLKDNYWLYTTKGFYTYDKSGKLVLSNDGLKLNASINKTLIDKTGTYWFSSLTAGLYLIKDFSNVYFNFPNHRFIDIAKLNGKYVGITSDSKILEYDTNFVEQKEIINWEQVNHVNTLYVDEQSGLLFYTTTTGMFVFKGKKRIYFDDNAAKNILRLDHKYFAITGSGFVTLLLDPSLANSAVVSRWDGLFNKFQNSEKPQTAVVLKNLRARSIDFFEDEGSLLVTSNIGFFKIDTQKVEPFEVGGQPLFASKVFSHNKKLFIFDNTGNLHLLYKSGRRVCLNSDIGIPANSIRFIKRSKNLLYIVTAYRIFEFDMSNASTTNFSFNTNLMDVHNVLKDGNHLLVLSESNVIRLNLKTKSIEHDAASFYFNNFYLFNDKIERSRLQGLSHHENSLKFTYSLIDFGTNKEPKMSYRINGGEWIVLPTGARDIQLVSLSPGNYDLELKMNNILLMDKLYFSIERPFYLQTWFIVVVIIILGLIVLLIYQRRMRIMRKKIAQLHEKIILENELRTSMLTSIKAQMNPHFFYNALNTIQSYIFSNDKFNATTYLAKFSKLTRMILEMSGEPTVRLDQEVSALKLYLELEQMRFQTDFSFSIEVDASLDKANLQIPSMLIQPYVENAVKHGLLHKEGVKYVSIIMLDKGSYIQVVIDDNGVGRARSEEINRFKVDKPKSFSTASNLKRLELINQGKDIVSVVFEDKYGQEQQALGTKVIVNISKI